MKKINSVLASPNASAPNFHLGVVVEKKKTLVIVNLLIEYASF